ncbi:hypothetical protein BCP6_003 [Bacillus phage BCP6]|nr:hypothetical protein BCP6_003 [Bacillus phage BCP6]
MILIICVMIRFLIIYINKLQYKNNTRSIHKIFQGMILIYLHITIY